VGRIAAAKTTLFDAIAKASDWSEFWMELSYIYYGEGNCEASIGTALMAHNNAPPPTQLWREINKYTDQPLRLISWCYEHMADTPNALKYALDARAAIGRPDGEWEDRIARLQGAPQAVPADHTANVRLSSRREAHRIALHRPGAIGDILVTLNLVP